MDQVIKLLQENNLQKVFEKISKDKPMSYQYGPLNKSQETQIFEEVIHDIIKDYEDGTKNITFSKQNGQILLNRKGESINLKNLLDNVNFNHLSISKEDIRKYAANKRLYISPLSYEEFQKQIKEADVQQEVSLSALDYGEMLAINKYTGPYYKTMSLLLRNTDSMQTNQVASTMLHIAMASHGLSKLPDIDLPQVIRSQDEYNLTQLIENARNHKVSQEKSFISTSLSYNVKIDTESNNKNVRIIYKNVRGKSISAISQRPDESEYLISPSTQIRWIGYKNTGAVHVFTAEGANVIIDEPSLPAFKASTEIIHAAENLEKKINSQVSYIANPVVAKKETISDQLTKISSEALTRSCPPKSTLSQQVVTPVVNANGSNTIKPKVEIAGSVAESINKLSPTIKPVLSSKPTNSLNLHHQIPVLDINKNNDTKLIEENVGKVKQELEYFGREIVDIIINNNLITQHHKAKYFEVDSINKESKFFNDIKKIVNEKTSLKNKIQSLAKKISKSLGITSVYFYLNKKMNDTTYFKKKQNNKKTASDKKQPFTKKSSTQWYL